MRGKMSKFKAKVAENGCSLDKAFNTEVANFNKQYERLLGAIGINHINDIYCAIVVNIMLNLYYF
jgi:hypothetical protein